MYIVPNEYIILLKNKPKNHFIDEIDQNELMRRDTKKFAPILNYKLSLISSSTVMGFVSFSAFTSLVRISTFPVGAITAGIKNHTSIIKRKRDKHDEILLLAKLNNIEVSISLNRIMYVKNQETLTVHQWF